MKTFHDVVRDPNVIFFVGSGLSAFTTDNDPAATWAGLIRSGADRVVALDKCVDPSWRNVIESMIGMPETAMIISAATQVSNKLKNLGEDKFANWISADIGSLEIKNKSAIKALLKYSLPIVTTNYDTLIEDAGRRETADWTETHRFQEAMTRESGAIAHLHGVWKNPESVILTDLDYERLRSNASTKALTQAALATKSIVYIGFGSGLDDPHFSNLLKWEAETFRVSTVQQYKLCRNHEIDGLKSSRIIPVSYGDDYEDLPAFLEQHVPKRELISINDAGLARDIVQDSRMQLRESMVDDSLLVAVGVGDIDSSDLITPPVFLPMEYSRFTREQMRRKPTEDLQPLDGREEVQKHDFFVVVGDEGAGVTTAIKWLAAEASEAYGSAAPLYIRYEQCKNSQHPIQYAAANEAKNLGLIVNRKDEIPPFVLAIDDVDSNNKKLCENVLSDINQPNSIVNIVGCKEGSEESVTNILSNLGHEVRILYLGRMKQKDIKSLANRISPTRGNSLASQAMHILESEGLQRTPMTISLLLYLLDNGGAKSIRNQTIMIDSFVLLLITSAGDPHDNSTGLEDRDIGAILEHLAESMIRDELVSLQTHDVEGRINKVIEKFNWQSAANSRQIVDFLLRRKILRQRGSEIQFARYSYFTLFAAKRAVASENFRAYICEDIFYFKPVVTRLAAFTRNDGKLLGLLRPLLVEELANATDPGSPYELLQPVSISKEPARQDPEDGVDSFERDAGDELEFPENNSPGGFGLVKSDMTAAERIARSVILASSVLRDLDQTEDIEEKRNLLVMVLELWGQYITALSHDPIIRDFEATLKRNLSDAAKDNYAIRDFFVRSLPAGTALNGIDSSLVSPKLTAAFNDATEAGETLLTEERRTAALFFLISLRPSGWVGTSKQIVEKSENTWILTTFYRAVCEDAFSRGCEPRDALLNLCVDLYLRGNDFDSPALRSAHLNNYRKKLITAKARFKSK